MITNLFAHHPLPWRLVGEEVLDKTGQRVFKAGSEAWENVLLLIEEINAACHMTDCPPNTATVEVDVVMHGGGRKPFQIGLADQHTPADRVVRVSVTDSTSQWELLSKVLMQYWLRGVPPLPEQRPIG